MGGVALPIAFFGKFYVVRRGPVVGLEHRRGDGPAGQHGPRLVGAFGQGVRGVLEGYLVDGHRLTLECRVRQNAGFSRTLASTAPEIQELVKH